MSVYQRKDGRWAVRYRKGTNTQDPNREWEYFGRGEAARKAAVRRDKELKEDTGQRKKRKDGSPLFVAVAEEYMNANMARISGSDMRALFWKLRGVIFPVIGSKPCMSITHSVLDKYVSDRLKAGRKKTTIHRELSYIRAILNFAVDRKLLSESPFSGYKMPKRDDTMIVPPTHADFCAILEKAPPHLKRCILITYYTGLRPGPVELFSLTWGAFDLVAGTVAVVSANKGGIPFRSVPLHPELLEHLAVWKEEDKNSETDFVIHWNGKPVQSIKSAWRSTLKRAGVDRRIRPYSLRHKTISDMLANGADVKTVSEIVGHADPAMTMRVYQQTNTAMKTSAVGLLGTTKNVVPEKEKL